MRSLTTLASRRTCAKNISGVCAFSICSGIYVNKVSVLTLNMAYNYVVSAHKPTAVNACVTGKVLNSIANDMSRITNLYCKLGLA